MNFPKTICRLGLASILLGSLGACVVVPSYPTGYAPAPSPAYAEPYPAYAYPSANIYYAPGASYYGGGHYDRRYDDRPRGHGPIDNALRLRRDIHRSLGLPF